MNNKFIYSDNNKRYLTLAYHNRKLFGTRVYKASINLGCSCPNIDGSLGRGGCTYCEGSFEIPRPIGEQLLKETKRIEQKNSSARIIAYFQNGSNTYCEPHFLDMACKQVLEHSNVVGISIGTRADCLNEAMVDILYMLSKQTYLTVELGLQTIHDITAQRINRCHSFNQFIKGYEMLKCRGIRVCVHLINSLPGENMNMMIESAKQVGGLSPDGIKIHMLNILCGTQIAKQYETNPFHIQSREEYVETVVKQLEYIPPTTVIERLTGDGIKSRIIAPSWVKDKLKTLVEIDKLQAAIDSYQGKALE